MNTPIKIACTLLVAGLLANTGCSYQEAPPPLVYPHGTMPANAEPLKLVASVHGSDSRLTAPTVAIIQTKEELERVGGEAAKLTVDFATQSAVVLAMGTQPTGGYWTRITAVHLAKNTLWVSGLANRPASQSGVTAALTSPYSVVVIPKVDRVLLVSDITSTVGEEPPGGK